MTSITSAQNPRLKAVRRLATRRERARSGRFAVEGEDLVRAARQAGREPVEGFRLAGSGVGETGFHDVDAPTLRGVSTLGSGTRVIAVYEQRWSGPVGPLCVYLHGVADPGNVGTILRSAHAFGASCVALGPGCADPHSPKAVRASMGAIFAVALARASAVEQLPGERVALSASAEETLRAPDGDGTQSTITLLVGAERDGLPRELLEACERSARIPIASDSLNAAMAATVGLYELTRARDGAPRSSRVRTR
ncbi:MAG: methyltransferase, TrmH family [Solirubrobacteraceae bacterium]|jgi:TrmH family RNA methyltransferase|nr:methyltransferase, TrmH family [Solirubrobacteraceae bacterium]